MIIALSPNNTTNNTDQLTFADKTNITISDSNGKTLNFTFAINSTTIVIQNVSLFEGTNTFHIASLVGPKSSTTTLITVKTLQNILNSNVIATIDSTTIASTLLITFVNKIELKINE